MSKVGLWIDHKKAVIVFLAGKEKEIQVINANIEKPHRQSGVAFRADDLDQRVLTEHLNNYYDEVISRLGNAESILIMGAGEAKGELKKRIKINNHRECVIDVEAADKMSERQIVAKVRDYFLKHKSAVNSK